MPQRAYRRRSDRLHKLAELLRTPEPQRPGALAELLQVSVPTLCSDVSELQIQGLAIEGNAASGWRFLRQAAIGPLSFSHGEVQALLAALRHAQPLLAPALAQQAGAALERMLALLTPEQRAETERLASFAPAPITESAALEQLEALRRAGDARRKLRFAYQEDDGSRSEQRVRPLACQCEDGVWTLVAWREEAGDFGRFRIDRLERLEVLDETFEDEAGRTLTDMAAREPGLEPSDGARPGA